MNRFRAHDNSIDDESKGEIEALIRSAQSFVQVSDELRPRVLEVARLQRSERRARRQIERLAAVALVLAVLVASLRPSSEPLPQLRAQFVEQEVISRPGDASWNLVEVFTEIRRRQAEVFRPTFEHSSSRNPSEVPRGGA